MTGSMWLHDDCNIIDEVQREAYCQVNETLIKRINMNVLRALY